MRSTHDFLADPKQSELRKLTDKVMADCKADVIATQRAEQFIEQLVGFMQREKLEIECIDGSQREHNQRLLDLMRNAVNSRIDQKNFNDGLVEWANLSVLHAQSVSAHEGIIRALLNDEDTSNQNGDHEDVCFVLRDYIVRDSRHIQADEYNILAPVNLDSHHGLLSVVEDAIKGNEDKDFSLLIQGCADRSHYYVVELEVREAQITRAELRDPKGSDTDALRSTSAYKNVAQVTEEINGDNKTIVEAVKTDVQPVGNSHSCMDYGLKDMLEKVGVENDITSAASDVGLRQAIVAEISEHHPVVLAHKMDHENFHAVLNRPENNKMQIQFDELMARKLQESLDKLTENDSKDAELPLIEEARKHAYAELLKRHGMMAKSPVDTSVAIAAPIATLVK